MPTMVLPPALDFHSDLALHDESRARVVGLSAARSDLIRRAAENDRRYLLVTDERSVLTPPMHDALLSSGGVWVVREGDGHGPKRDAVTGRRVADMADALNGAGRVEADNTSPIFLRQVPDDDTLPAWAIDDVRRLVDAPTTQQVIISMSVRHNARRTTVLGLTAELLLDALTGSGPSSWGTAEPALAPWDRAELTRYARGRAPDDTHLVVVAPHAVGTVTVRRTADGLEETTQLTLGAGDPRSDAARSVLDGIPAAFTLVAQKVMALFGLALTRVGRADLNVPPIVEAPAVPLTMLVGPPGVRSLGLDLDAAAQQFGGTQVGRRRLPGVLLPLGTGDRVGWTRLTEVVEWIGPGRVREALTSEDDRTSASTPQTGGHLAP
ncbi:DUF6177 family protein [Promicromonospora sp. NPDC023805]|uniref:DUF6177 family protein n=1 Tax=Promicromonospora sp. NPDC023805 TaxID=3154696 RepID=UPI0033E9C363